MTVCLLCRRTSRNLSRDRMGVLMRLSQNLIYSLFVAFFVMRLDIDMSKGAVQDRFGIIYQSIGASPYTGMLNAVALCEFTLPEELGGGFRFRFLILVAQDKKPKISSCFLYL